MRNLRLLIEYDGTDFHGWQQPARVAHGPGLPGRGRAHDDRRDGVGARRGTHRRRRTRRRPGGDLHARGAHPRGGAAARPELASCRRTSPCSTCARRRPTSTRASRRAARSTAIAIWNHLVRSPLHARSAWHIRSVLDMAAMHAAARALCGEHDFRAFRASDCERRTTVRVVRRLDVERQGALLTIEVEATAFLKNMVRILVGTLVDLGRGQHRARRHRAHAADRRPRRRRHHRPTPGVDAAQGDLLVREGYAPVAFAAGGCGAVVISKICARTRSSSASRSSSVRPTVEIGSPTSTSIGARVDQHAPARHHVRGCRGCRTGRCRRPTRSPGESHPS